MAVKARGTAHSRSLSRVFWRAVLQDDLPREHAEAYYKLATKHLKEETTGRLEMCAVAFYLEVLMARQPFTTTRPTIKELAMHAKHTLRTHPDKLKMFVALSVMDSFKRSLDGVGLVEGSAETVTKMREFTLKWLVSMARKPVVPS